MKLVFPNSLVDNMFSKKVFEGGGLLSQVVQICFVGPALCTNQELSDSSHVYSVGCIHVQPNSPITALSLHIPVLALETQNHQTKVD